MAAKKKNSSNIRITVVKNMRDYNKEPFFVKKLERAKAFLEQHPFPEQQAKPQPKTKPQCSRKKIK